MTRKVIIIAGGTGGHIFPGIAVAEALVLQGYAVVWLGSEIGMEQSLVATQFNFHALSVYQLRGKGLKAFLLLPMRLCRAVCQAVRLLHHIKPDIVISFGGFVAGPGSIAAKLLRKPLIIHEQNARAGLTNRWLAILANIILEAFPHTLKQARTVGNPIRASIQSLMPPTARLQSHHGPLRILVLGGSLGARALNTAIVAWLQQFPRIHEVMVCHQTGKAHYDEVQAAYATHHLAGDVMPFISDMAAAFEWADLVICRAGAITVSEVAVVGIAAIFVPLPHAVDNHQFYNADYLTSNGAAWMLEEHELSSSRLSEIVKRLLDDRDIILTMSTAARALAKPHATQDIVSAIQECVSNVSKS